METKKMPAPPQLEESWKEVLKDEWSKPYVFELAQFVAKERSSGIPVYPPKEDVFNAFRYASFDKVKVVIVGQDPYHGAGQAHGLCFSVRPGVPLPPSLQNIFKELKDDLSIPMPPHGCLISWAKQGVLLLNTVLTVREKEPRSHYGKGWERFTDAVVSQLNQRQDPVIFVLWGKAALDKCNSIAQRHAILTAPHPSSYSAHSGFFGCRHFSKINEILKTQGKDQIDWTIR